MSRPAPSLPEAFATLAERAAEIDVARFYDGTDLKGETYLLLGALIRAADVLLEHRVVDPSDDPLVFDFMRMARGLRNMAYAVLAEANPEQAWFWTEEWQARERAVEANIATGDLIHFESDDALLAELTALNDQSA